MLDKDCDACRSDPDESLEVRRSKNRKGFIVIFSMSISLTAIGRGFDREEEDEEVEALVGVDLFFCMSCNVARKLDAEEFSFISGS